MFQLVYVSSAIQPFSKADLVELLSKSRAKNQRLGITGMLLYKDGNFMQVLEGEDVVVRGLFDTIECDPRHHGTIVLLEQTLPQHDNSGAERTFANWSMGFRNFADADTRQLEGVNQFMNYAFTGRYYVENPGTCWGLLTLFRDIR